MTPGTSRRSRAGRPARALALAAVVALCAIPLPAQADRPPLEQPGGAPVAADRLPQGRSPARVSVHDTLQSIQVNVDAGGQNVVGDAANEPTLAVSRLDRRKIAVGWRQFDSIASDFRQAGVNVSFDGGRTWEAKGVLGPGIFGSDPVLATAADGTFLYSTLHAPSYCTDIYASLDDLASWDGPIYSYGGDKQWIAVDTRQGQGRGHVYQAWDYANCDNGGNWFNRSTDEGATWEPPVPLLGDPFWGTPAIAPDGGLWVAGTTDGASLFGAARSSNARDPGASPTFDRFASLNLGGSLVSFCGACPNPGGLNGQVWMAIDNSHGPRRGWIYVLATVDPAGADPEDVHLIRSTDGGTTWSAPVRINDDPTGNGAWQWFGTLSVAPNGRIDAIWNDTRNHPGTYLSELWYSYSDDGGTTWAPNVQLSEAFDPQIGWPQQNKIGDYYGMVSDKVGADVIYSATFNGEQDVYYLRINDRDCNDNGVGDADDILSGFDTDLDLDGIPDRCELDTDADGAVDALDNCVFVPNRDQLDADENGVGDACDPLIFADDFESGNTSSWSVVLP